MPESYYDPRGVKRDLADVSWAGDQASAMSAHAAVDYKNMFGNTDADSNAIRSILESYFGTEEKVEA